jgi:hypothetical protein
MKYLLISIITIFLFACEDDRITDIIEANKQRLDYDEKVDKLKDLKDSIDKYFEPTISKFGWKLVDSIETSNISDYNFDNIFKDFQIKDKGRYREIEQISTLFEWDGDNFYFDYLNLDSIYERTENTHELFGDRELRYYTSKTKSSETLVNISQKAKIWNVNLISTFP